MTKQEWEELYQTLDDIHSDFLMDEHQYKTGKNKAIRAAADRKISHLLYRAGHYIRQHEEVFILLTGGEGVDDQARTMIYNDFMSHQYFGYDMGEGLRKIEEKIKSLDGETGPIIVGE